ncbi:hypothetical protein CISG_07421 [Coccidioides immitis RMSCC 3703]|uniref:Uncharacterized protein n=2 Tax=Coccidioides immitis TaxID=5501 RepID=A0A0J8R169_COCIT|nr:hypothetical protein CIRG_03878 [Coccidioides immitis RMSCC 2394]KMU78904.1 hypothetical protein CISG_07421 [Coccidioides immitis RMSCC 3703]
MTDAYLFAYEDTRPDTARFAQSSNAFRLDVCWLQISGKPPVEREYGVASALWYRERHKARIFNVLYVWEWFLVVGSFYQSTQQRTIHSITGKEISMSSASRQNMPNLKICDRITYSLGFHYLIGCFMADLNLSSALFVCYGLALKPALLQRHEGVCP